MESIEVRYLTEQDQYLWLEIENINKQLAALGVTCPISIILYGAIAHGYDYEDRRYPRGGVKPTPLNCLMALLHDQPELHTLPANQFEKLASLVSRISMVVEVLIERHGQIDWPSQYTRKPQ